MTDGNNRREGLASANTIEPADRDNSVGFSLTRRSFMAAGGATAVASATDVLAAEKAGWSWSRESDGAGKWVYTVSHPKIARPWFDAVRSVHFGSSDLVFREAEFGEQARITVIPIPNRRGRLNEDGLIDLRLHIEGANLLPNATGGLFDFEFEFFHRSEDEEDDVPSVDILATGWVFSKKLAGRTLLARKVTTGQLKDSWATPIALNAASRDLPERFRKAVFEDLAASPRQGRTTLSVIPTMLASQRFKWVLRAGGFAPDKPQNGYAISVKAAGGEFARTALATGGELHIWRDYGSEADAPKNSSVGAGEDEPSGYVTRGWLTEAFPASSRVVLAEHTPPKPHKSATTSPVLVPRRVIGATLARWSGDGEKETIAADVRLQASLSVVTCSRKPGAPDLTEGSFPVSGTVRVSKTPGDHNRSVDAGFSIEPERFTLSTGFGVYTATKPEEKKLQGLAAPARSDVRIASESFRCITGFEINTRLDDASVSLVADALSKSDAAATGHFGQLKFPRGAEVTFRLHALGDTEAADPAIGRIFLGYLADVPAASDVRGPPSSIPMDFAELSLLRYSDLVALKYRFQGLDLVTDGQSTLLRPRGLAVVDPGVDPRPMIAVEFPPQHRAEQAFFERRESRPAAPRMPVWMREREEIAEQLTVLRDDYPENDADMPANREVRLAARMAILASLLEAVDPDEKSYAELRKLISDLSKLISAKVEPSKIALSLADCSEAQTFLDFANEFAKETEGKRLPDEQRLFVGREFLDAEAQLRAEVAEDKIQARFSGPDGGNALTDGVPPDPISMEELYSIEKSGLPADDIKRQLLDLRLARDPGYLDFKQKYDDKFKGFFGIAPLPAGFQPVKHLEEFDGRDLLRQAVIDLRIQAVDKDDAENEKIKVKLLDDWLVGYREKLDKLLAETASKTDSSIEDPVRPVQSRLSGRSRLVLRINTDDYETRARGGEIPFTVDDLTNFSRFELAVPRRAQKLFKTYEDGTHRPLWHLEEDHDLGNILAFQGFSRGGLSRFKEPKPDDPKDDLEWEDPAAPRDWPEARVTVDQRLAELVSLSAAPPAEFETSIEMPFRLMLSPSQDGLFRTPRRVPPKLFQEGATPTSADEADARTHALWTAELDPESRAQLRAIWSPDFRPEAFLPHEKGRNRWFFPRKKSRSNRAPLKGPFAPWALGRNMSSNDDAPAMQAHRFRTSLDAFDRHELVALSSVHGLPVIGRVSLDGSRIGIDQREPPPGFQVSLRGEPEEKDAEQWLNRWLEYNDVYVPRPLDPINLELALSALGGYLTVNASFEPPAAVLDFERGSLFDALSIERWRHNIVLGRDISAEVVYKGYLMPFGIRASLVKSTQRRFQAVEGRNSPVAVLRQRMFIRISKPEKEYPAFRQSDDGRRVPFRKVRILTTQSPDIVDPYDLSGVPDDTEVWSTGLIDLTPRPKDTPPDPQQGRLSGTPFWPRTARRPGAEVMFEIMFDDSIKVRMPLVFVDNITVNNEESLRELSYYYNLLGSRSGYEAYRARAYLVQRPLFGQQLTFAPSLDEGDTQFQTETVTFGVEGRADGLMHAVPENYIPARTNSFYESDPFMQGADQPPFYPAMHRASVTVAQIERLTGLKGEPVIVGYDSTYALKGFDPPNTPVGEKQNSRDIFLALLEPTALAFGNSGERGGAVARPELNVVGLSRSRGPISNKDIKAPADAAPAAGVPEFKPIAHEMKSASLGDFFPEKAKLLGVVKISELLKLLAKVLDLEPKLREITEFGGGLGDDADSFIRENVLRPLLSALDAFDKRAAAIEYNGFTGAAALAKIYPEVSASLADFRASLQKAIDALPPSEGLEASIEAYSAVYSSGRRFASAIERVARDPVTPLREAFRRTVQDYLGTLNMELTTTVNAVLKIFDPKTLRAAAVGLLKEAMLTETQDAASAVAHLIFRIPVPLDPHPAGSEADVAAGLDRALATAIKETSTWPDEGPLLDPKAFGDNLVVALKVERDKFAAGSPLAIWWNGQVDAAEAALQNAIDEFEGRLWGLFDEATVKVTDALTTLAGFTVEKLGEAIEKLQQAGNAIASIFAIIDHLKRLGDLYTAQCALVVDAIDKLARTILPIDAGQVDVTACFADEAAFDWDKCRTDPSIPRPYVAVAAVSRFAKSVDALADDGQQKLKKLLDEVDDVPSDAVKGAAQPLHELQQMLTDDGDLRATVRGASTDLLDAAKRIDAQIKAYAAGYTVVIGNMDDACANPAILLARLVEPLSELERQRRRALNQLTRLSGTMTKLFGIVAEKTPVGAVTRPSGWPTAPNPDAEASEWVWDQHTNLDEQQALYLIETARKDIIGALLTPIGCAADLFAGLSSVAAYAADQTDAAKKAASAALATALEKLRDIAAGVANSTQIANNLNAASGFIKNGNLPALQQATAEVDKYVAAWKDKFEGGLWELLKKPDSAIGDLKAELNDAIASDFATLREKVIDVVFSKAGQKAEELLQDLQDGLEARLTDFLFRALSKGEDVYKQALLHLKPALTEASGKLFTGLDAVLKARNEVLESIKDPTSGATAEMVAALNLSLKQLFVACPTDTNNPQADLLDIQVDELESIKNGFANATGPDDAAEQLFNLIKGWVDKGGARTCVAGETPQPNAVLIILGQLSGAVNDLIRRDFAKLIDIGVVRSIVEDKLKELIPTRVTLAYDFDVELKEDAAGGIFIPAGSKKALDNNVFDPGTPACKLVLRARTSIDLLKPSPPKIDVSGSLGVFAIKLVGDEFNIITLKFAGAKYGSETGGKFKTSVTGVDLGEMVAFIDQFSQYVSFGDSGFYLTLRYDLPGIEAGYRMAPIYLTLGALNISNLSLNAACILPFSDGEALFKVGVSRPESPFSITVGIYGGAGHIALYASSSGIIGFTASLEFGAIVDFRFGPLAGRGQVTAGIYIRSLKMGGGKRVSTLEGVFTAAGSANIAMFRVSAMLQVRVGQQASGGVAGSAVFTFSFSLGIKDIEFRFVIFKQEGKNFGGGGMSSPTGMLPPGRVQYAQNQLNALSDSSPQGEDWSRWRSGNSDGPTLFAETATPETNFREYMKHFSEVDPWLPL